MHRVIQLLIEAKGNLYKLQVNVAIVKSNYMRETPQKLYST